MDLPRRKIKGDFMKQQEPGFNNFENKRDSDKKLIFPSGFFWGSATSAHQVEGGNFNDWSEWEKENAARLAAQAAKRSEPWPDYILSRYPNPLEPENYISGRACDHYSRFEEDFDILKSLGQNAHRFSIEWSRIEPEEGKFNQEAIEHYRKVILVLRVRGIEPFVTLWHWTVPLWFRDVGGWENKKAVDYFIRYAERMAREFFEVKFWITLNETNVQSGLACWQGQWPPEKKSAIKYLKVNHHLSQAHKAVYDAIKKVNSQAQIGIAHNVVYFTRPFAFLRRFFWNHFFIRSIRSRQDFVGVNYYHSDRDTEKHSEFLDWSIDPDGLYAALKEVSVYNKPIYITENGIADARDEKRAKFIKDHLSQVAKAVQEGIDVRGYFYWSLLDNFEWDKGFWPRFGLVEIDYLPDGKAGKTLERKIRPSALEYAKICRENKITEV